MKCLLLCCAFAGLLASCGSSPAPKPPPPPPPANLEPVGDGLSVIGFALVSAAVVLVLGRMLQ